jgi:hypothetical protein
MSILRHRCSRQPDTRGMIRCLLRPSSCYMSPPDTASTCAPVHYSNTPPHTACTPRPPHHRTSQLDRAYNASRRAWRRTQSHLRWLALGNFSSSLRNTPPNSTSRMCPRRTTCTRWSSQSPC